MGPNQLREASQQKFVIKFSYSINVYEGSIKNNKLIWKRTYPD